MERERDAEQKLVKGMKVLGGVALKFVSPGNAGVPDRIVIRPDGYVEFVEMKTIKGVVSAIQERQIYRLRSLGCRVRVLYGSKDVADFLDEMRGAL